MAISVNPMTYVVTIPQTDLTLVEGTLYELDVNDLRSWCHDWMDDQNGGITHPKMFTHYSEYTVAGVTYARAIIFLAPYSFTFEDGQYSVRLTGANTNLFDVENDILNQNQVQVISANSAGLQTVASGSGLSQEEHDKLMGLINGLTTAQETWLDELYQLQGLKDGSPMTVTPTSRSVGGISQTISGDGETSTTVTRD
ncbi:MAG: hypothetical protein GWN00_34420 [Aliifodinibius sp.]|nr:hypothetical protein [Fodinibius sp.]NIY29698.1 hypothetical protein [Fodinibius sp.]